MTVQVLVHGIDGPAFDDGPSEVHEAHQTYMDGFASALVARGPVLSPDGDRHRGSVHVVAVDQPPDGCRFAFDEPYARAGWYSSVAVRPYVAAQPGTMWDRPRPKGGQPSAFVVATWEPAPHDDSWADRLDEALAGDPGPPWPFCGLLLSDDRSQACGLAAAVDLAPSEATRRVEPLLAALPLPSSPRIDAQRWRRGGRDQP